uniref:Uncharacterized protein n=1 Tax=Timema bartmani TaxID=61472 RepID=A0A7R9EW94_9NEOP|nr:unnamed protein product [Timema bartmani]
MDSIPPEQCDAVRLRVAGPLKYVFMFLATGDSLASLQNLHRVPKCTMSKFLLEVLDAIHESLKDSIQPPFLIHSPLILPPQPILFSNLILKLTPDGSSPGCGLLGKMFGGHIASKHLELEEYAQAHDCSIIWAVALAPSPVLVGYSLVGVYPCAVWKPRRVALRTPCSCSSTTPAASTPSSGAAGSRGLRVASTVRAVPYPQQLYQFHATPATAARPPPPQSTNSAPLSVNNNPPPGAGQIPSHHHQHHPTTQIPTVVEQCRCRGGGGDEDGGCGDAVVPPPTNSAATPIALNSTPMLFVPFSVPNFAAPPLAGSLGTNNSSPSGGTTPAKVGTILSTQDTPMLLELGRIKGGGLASVGAVGEVILLGLYEINLCSDHGLNLGPLAQKSDTLPLDHQVTRLYLKGTGGKV